MALLDGSLNSAVSLDDFQEIARRVLPHAVYEYVASGSDDEQTLLENRAGFKRVFLVPRMLRDVSRVNPKIRIFGDDCAMPVLIAPAGVHKLMHPDGEAATARAAFAAGIIMAVSQHATMSLEDVAAAAPSGRRWFQLYILKDRELTVRILRRAEAANYSAIVITVDSPRFGTREADWRNGFNGLPAGLSLANYPTDDGYNDRVRDSWDQNSEKLLDDGASWADVAWVRSLTTLPLLVKGLMSPLDASEAVQAGADGIIVSNHGGRQLDGAFSTIEALPAIVEAVRQWPRGRDLPILLDSGVRRGTDVVKALALGATAVMLGRPVFFALAAGGEAGCSRMLELMKSEVESCMALCGAGSVADIAEEMVARRSGGSHYTRARL